MPPLEPAFNAAQHIGVLATCVIMITGALCLVITLAGRAYTQSYVKTREHEGHIDSQQVDLLDSFHRQTVAERGRFDAERTGEWQSVRAELRAISATCVKILDILNRLNGDLK